VCQNPQNEYRITQKKTIIDSGLTGQTWLCAEREKKMEIHAVKRFLQMACEYPPLWFPRIGKRNENKIRPD